ncbi:prepilin-type N-terminal cleavage/methylation domain-containing protein [Candidatus Nomurabacteria bacterium]|nr:prepilin-type N-terminal cleavage/methylation domain-containing protein [Candidatus Nomurabacteria bacterium]
MKNTKTIKGFTLIELLVVVAIIGLLSSIVMASLNTARAKARDAQRISSIKQVQTALELYYDTKGFYPASPDSPFPGGVVTAALTPNYISQMPKDPTNVEPYVYRYYNNNNSSFYAIRINYEIRTPDCYVCGGPSATCASGNNSWWSLPMCAY